MFEEDMLLGYADKDDMDSKIVFDPSLDYSKYVPKVFPTYHTRKKPFTPVFKLGPVYRRKMKEIIVMDASIGDMVVQKKDIMAQLDRVFSGYYMESADKNEALTKEAVITIAEAVYDCASTPDAESELLTELAHLMGMFGIDGPNWGPEIPDLVNCILSGNLYEGKGAEYRAEKYVVTKDDGSEHAHLCDPAFVKKDFAELMDWVNTSPFDSICTTAVFIHEFLCIRPYASANIRTLQILTRMIMYMFGLRNIFLCDYNWEMGPDNWTFLNMMACTMRTHDYSAMVMYLTDALHVSYKRLFYKFFHRDMFLGCDMYTMLIARGAKTSNEDFTMADVCGWVPDIGEQTIRTKLNVLLEMGIISKIGTTRSTKFRYTAVFGPFDDYGVIGVVPDKCDSTMQGEGGVMLKSRNTNCQRVPLGWRGKRR
ncbi:MAG: Fic family protein [Candidatus Methanomethylophilaceae archaeon]|nr:Fic family protein [Candidatus Methanomethylophilaceae archaeon]